jgi:YegS/Rv2252/BmrU family lipid kinase
MRAAAILGLGSSTHDLRRFQEAPGVDFEVGLPASREQLDAILIFGGDGTVHRHLGSLVKLELPVVVVPAGSGNDFARALGLSRVADSLAAWRKFVAGESVPRSVDLGTIKPLAAHTTALPGALATEQKYFSCAAGVGLDGEIARRANALPRWLRAHGGYALSLPAALIKFHPFNLRLRTSSTQNEVAFVAQTEKRVVAAVVANTPYYGGGMKIAPKAQTDDGKLDVCLIREISKVKLLGVFPSVYFGKHLGLREVEYFSGSCVRLETDRPLDVYADGEYVTRTPVEFGVAPKALKVIAQ